MGIHFALHSECVPRQTCLRSTHICYELSHVQEDPQNDKLDKMKVLGKFVVIVALPFILVLFPMG